MVFHCFNRGNNQAEIFADDADYAAFEEVLTEVIDAVPIRLLSYCLMPDHWHLLLWPAKAGELGQFMQRLTVTHVRRWHERRQSTGRGHVYQGTYKSFPVQADEHLLAVARYVESNALRRNRVRRAQDWRWNSLWRRQYGQESEQAILSEWPVNPPRNWLARVNRPQSDAEEEAIRISIRRGRPYGDNEWQQLTAAKLGLEKTFRPRGRPKLQLVPA